MKRLFIFTGILIMLMGLASPALLASTKAPAKIRVLVDQKSLAFDVQPQLVNGRVLVPLRTVFQSLGAKVLWDHKTQTITATKGRSKLKITLYQRTAYKNDQPITLDAPPIIQKERTLVPLRFVAEALGTSVEWNDKTKTVAIDSRNLPLVSSQQNLKALLAEVQNLQASRNYLGEANQEIATAPQMKAKNDKAEAGADYSATNVQVQGVDEADVIKTDGKYIYQVNNGRIVIAQAYPDDQMKLVKILKFDEKGFNPSEIYVDQKHLVVIGNNYNNMPLPENGTIQPKIAPGRPGIYPPNRIQNTAKVLIYDISDKANIKKIRETELEGNYLSSRKIGSSLYLVANKYIDYYYIMEQKGAPLTPAYRDSVKATKFTNIDYANIRYFPDSIEPNYLMIAGLNLNDPQGDLQLTTYLGSGQNLYSSQNNLYLAVTEYQEDLSKQPTPSTAIYKFALYQGQVKALGKGKVPGTILNQFSMDEHKGYFRIATTKGEAWRNDESTSKNNIYILDPALNITGKIEDIAPGERIYSVRFMGDRGYLVTFKNVDPLFVIDLKEPQAPKILGALKIPGYSDYLHPYDENHIIGFGKDTIEVSRKDWQGKEEGTMAFYLGMKIAIFDVTDVAHPVEKFKELIGDRGTESELLHNHKALLFSKEKNLLAFPITVMKTQNKLDSNGMPQYGQFDFQGAYVYNLDLVKGFTLRKKITHLGPADLEKAGQGWYEGGNNVERIIYIGDNLYTLSQGEIRAHDLSTLKDEGNLIIPG